MKILVIGSGGREHAIIHQIKQSPLTKAVFCIPGNAGIESICSVNSNIKIDDNQAIINFCHQNQIDLVIIGPEQPLVNGLVDDLKKAGIKSFGPSKLASRLEGSKIFTKKICDKYHIATAKYQNFDNMAPAIKYLDEIGIPCVIKADGLAAGKGVIIAANKNEAETAIKEIFSGKFGEAGKKIIIEEFLTGPEVSFFAICDGKTALYFGDACDHKKVGENETGPNTGGMGTYSPSFLVSNELKNEIINSIINPTLKAMKAENSSFTGFLFAGLILTKDGPKLLEFNTRLGDPETQVLLPRLETDLVELIIKACDENLAGSEIKLKNEAAICVVLAANGYPENYQKGTEIKNLEAIKDKNIIVFHAGTKKENNKILANGGRVLGITALSKDIKQARIMVYGAINLIDWKEGFYRKDIALRALKD